MERLRRLSSPRWMSVYGWRLGAASVDVGILGSVYGRDWERLSSSGRYQSEAVPGMLTILQFDGSVESVVEA